MKVRVFTVKKTFTNKKIKIKNYEYLRILHNY